MNWQKLQADILTYRSYLLPVLAGVAVPLIWYLICSRLGIAGAATSRVLFFALMGGVLLFFYLVNVINQNPAGGGFNLITWLFVIILPLLTLLIEKGKAVATASSTAQNQADTLKIGEADKDAPAPEAEEVKKAELPRWVVLDALENMLPPAMYDDPTSPWRQAFPEVKENRWLQTFSGGIDHQTTPQYGVELLKINTAFREGILEFIPLEGIKGIRIGKEVGILTSIGSGFDERHPSIKEVKLQSGHDVWYISTSTTSFTKKWEEGPDACKYRINFTPAQESSVSTWPPGEVMTLEYHHPDGQTTEEPGPRLPLFIPDENGKPIEVWWSCRVVWDAPMEGYLFDKENPITGEPSRVLVGSTKNWSGRPEMTGTFAARTAKVIVRDENGKEIDSIPFHNRKHTFSAEEMLSRYKRLTGNERLFISCPNAATVSIAVFVRLKKMN